MRNAIKKWTPAPVRRLLGRVGRFFDETAEAGSPAVEHHEWDSLAILRDLGWRPERCIDVGAYHGSWATTFLSIFPESKVLMVEAQQGKRSVLESVVASHPDQLEFEIAVLGASDGKEVDFYEMETGSSVREEASPYPRERKARRTTRLDTVLADHPEFAKAEVLKIDVQGYEVEVLSGCPELLRRVEVAVVETPFLEVNRGASLFADNAQCMIEAGFTLFDLGRQFRRKDGVLWAADLIWVRGDSGIAVPPELTLENWG